jgi:hypothetical protein
MEKYLNYAPHHLSRGCEKPAQIFEKSLQISPRGHDGPTI